MKVLSDAGIYYELLGRDELEKAEPALARTKNKLMGGLRTPNDETGDCNLFTRSEEHTSELQSLMRISYAVFCLKKKNIQQSRPNLYQNTIVNKIEQYQH